MRSALRRLPWVGQIDVKFSTKEVYITSLRAKMDLAAIEKVLRHAGYPFEVTEPNPLPADLRKQFKQPAGRRVVLQISGWMKTKGCSPDGPTPEFLQQAIEALNGVTWVELDRIGDTMTVYTRGRNPRKSLLIREIGSRGASASIGEVKMPESFKIALERAGRTKKLLLVSFSSRTCAACKRMKNSTWKDDRVVAAVAKQIVLKVDTLRQPRLVHYFKLRGIPEIRIYGHDGKERARLSGYKTAEQVLAALKKAATN